MYRKMLVITLLGLATGLVSLPGAYGQENVSAEQVIESHLQAVGGEKAMAAIQDRTLKGGMSVMGMFGTMVWHEKAPNKMHQMMDLGFAKIETWFDGNQGYRMDPNRGDGPYSAQEVEEAKGNKVGGSPFVGYKGGGLKLRYVKRDRVGDNPVDVVEITDPKGKVTTYYFDTATHYVVQMVFPVPASQGTGNQELQFSDYRDVKGVKFPFKIVSTTTAASVEMTFDSIEVNTGLADTVFQHGS